MWAPRDEATVRGGSSNSVGEAQLLVVVEARPRRNFVCDGGDLSRPLFQSGICNFASNSKFHNIAILRTIPIFPYTLEFGQENRIFLATRSVLWPNTCRKCDSGRRSAPDPSGGAHDAPPDFLVGWGGDIPPHTRPHSSPLARRCSRLRRLDRRTPLPLNPGDATGHQHFLR